jgi:homogentisate phytyltransferase/homogentisate geranylgeranyltransferase
LKRFPLLAAISIFVVRGALVNLGFFLEAKLRVVAEIGILSQGFFSTCAQYPECLALATFFSLFGLVIAVMKDVPDVLGDTRYSIPSYTVKFGARRAFDFSRNLLVSLLGTSGAVITSFAVMALRKTGNSLVVISRSLVGFALIAMAVSARRRARLVNPEDSKAVFANYMFTWNFFYGCYALLPLLALS